MKTLRRNGVGLAFTDNESMDPVLLFVHGCGCDHSNFDEQIEAFRETHRVIAVDLRGHGSSDAPLSGYTTEIFADDLAWMLGELGIEAAAIIGHSMGGNIALEFGARYPSLSSAVMMIDSVLFPNSELIAAMRSLIDALNSEHYLLAYKDALRTISRSRDPAVLHVIDEIRAPQHVLKPSFESQTVGFDASSALRACSAPFAYVETETELANIGQLRAEYPKAQVARVLGAGHFCMIETPKQINAMIQRFVNLV